MKRESESVTHVGTGGQWEKVKKRADCSFTQWGFRPSINRVSQKV